MGIYRPTNFTATQNTPAEAEILDDLASLLRAGGSQVTVVPEIQRVKFAKNMWNAVLGASASLARESLRAFFRPPECEPGYDGSLPEAAPSNRSEPQTESERRTADVPRAAPALGEYTIPLLYDAMQELSALGQKLFASPNTSDGPVEGFDPDVGYKTLLNTARIHARPDSKHLPSMLVDVEAGRPMEVEHVVGEVVRMGRRAGVGMPVSVVPLGFAGCCGPDSWPWRGVADTDGVCWQRMETLYALLLVVQNQALRKYRESVRTKTQL